MISLEKLFYTEDHQWIKFNGKEAYIGITDYGQELFGEIDFVDLPDNNEEFQKGETYIAVEGSNVACDVYIPLSGEVIAVNDELSDNPALINDSPYRNWIIKISLSYKNEIEDLLSYSEYESICNNDI